MIASPPLVVTSEDSFSPRPTSSSSRHRGSQQGSPPVSVSFNNGKYSPPRALDLTPKPTSTPMQTAAAANHIMSAYLPPAFSGLLAASSASTVAGLSSHGPSFGQSGKWCPPTQQLFFVERFVYVYVVLPPRTFRFGTLRLFSFKLNGS